VLVPTSHASTSNGLVYFDIAIPAGATPGQYRGELRSSEGVVPVLLDVSAARIDLRREALVWVFYLPSDIANAEGLPDSDEPELLERENAYHALFRAHGAFLASDLGPERFAVRRRFVHDVKYCLSRSIPRATRRSRVTFALG